MATTFRPTLWLIRSTDGRRYVRLHIHPDGAMTFSWAPWRDAFVFGHWTKALRVIDDLHITDTTLEVWVHDRDIPLHDIQLYDY